MTGERRAQLRAAIDAHVRAERNLFLERVGRMVCRGCGCDLDTVVPGCKSCNSRSLARRNRAA